MTSETESGGTLPPGCGLARAGGVQHARLLVVTPDTGRAETLRTRLTLAGYGVDWAPNALLALAAAQAQRPDLALIAPTDAGEPGGETLAFLVQTLKAAAEGMYLPVLLLTKPCVDAEPGWAASGADDALPPDASDALLRLRVGALLHWKRRYQALADSVLEVEASCTAAQQAAARYAAVFMQNLEPMLLVGVNGQILEANLCASALAGWAPGALYGHPLARLCPPELLWAEQLTAQGPVGSFSDPDAALLTATGQIIPIEVRSAPVYWACQPGTNASMERAAPTLFVVILTDRRPERERLAEAQRAAAAETAIVFRREINNPLFVIAGNIELLQNALGQEDSGVQAKLGRIAEACRCLVEAAARASTLPAPEARED